MGATDKYLEEIDRLRGIAILMVIFHHLSTPPFGVLAPFVNPAFRDTWTGVDLFFVISGFVVFRSLARSSVLSFYRRRFWRIAPLALFWAALPLAAVWWMGGYSESTSVEQVGHDFLGIITLRFNYLYAFSTKASLLLVSYWSLCVEEHFYLLLPLLVWISPRRKFRLAAGVAIIAASPVVLRLWGYEWLSPPHPIPYFRTCTHCRLDGLFLGVLLADWWPIFDSKARHSPARVLAFNALSVAAILSLALVPNLMQSEAGYSWGLSATAAISGLLVALAARDRGYVLNIPLLRGFLASTGRYSYALYLIHVPAYFLVTALLRANGRDLSGADRAGFLLAYIAALTLFARASRRWIELPLIRYGRRAA